MYFITIKNLREKVTGTWDLGDILHPSQLRGWILILFSLTVFSDRMAQL